MEAQVWWDPTQESSVGYIILPMKLFYDIILGPAAIATRVIWSCKLFLMWVVLFHGISHMNKSYMIWLLMAV